MLSNEKILLAKSNDKDIFLYPKMANRHGLIAGVTGSGKTVTLKVLAESFSNMGVPVFMADVKGDLGSVSKKGELNEKVQNRVQKMAIQDWSYQSFPTHFWDLTGEKGHPVRTTISNMGPTLLSRLLGLTDAQEGVLNIVFKIADDKGWLLIDLKDLRTMINYVVENKDSFSMSYGLVSSQSAGAILRSLLKVEDQGGDKFFGEPAFDFYDFLKCNADGRGYINILHSVKLIQTPTIYSFFLLWLLSDMFEKLPEIGDCDKPKLVFFFDEAHLLFNQMPKALLERIVQVVKLIRSKGVGVYFISQSPRDIPGEVLAQLNNRVQHALHAYTPAEQKAVEIAASTFRNNPEFDTSTVISQLGIGEALVSLLQEDGTPAVVERCKILPPQSFMGTITDEERQQLINSSEFKGKYDVMVDNMSAYEEITGDTSHLTTTAKSAGSTVLQKAVSDTPSSENTAWLCICGAQNTTKFCSECGNPKPQRNSDSKIWICQCGFENISNYCSNCGKKKPVKKGDNSWNCKCGTKNNGKFCTNCGCQRPARKSDNSWTCSCGTKNEGNYCSNCGAANSKKLQQQPFSTQQYAQNTYNQRQCSPQSQQYGQQQYNQRYYVPQSQINGTPANSVISTTSSKTNTNNIENCLQKGVENSITSSIRNITRGLFGSIK